MASDKICVIPWIHLNIIPKGKVYHCCMTTDFDNYAGDLNSQTLEEIWNGDYLKTIRKQMINGVEPKACSRCFDEEKTRGLSNRTAQNKYFSKKLEEIPIITTDDGHVEQIDLKYWDFRFSNLCNFKCRTCGPEFSSSWMPDAEKLGWNAKNKKVLNINEVGQNTNIDFLKKYVNSVEKIYFAGGEPLLMDEHWQILEMLDQAGRHDVILTYNTNLSKLTYNGKNVLDYWKKWGRKVWLWPSIDEIDERAELVRSGTNWATVEKNLIEVADIGIHVKPNITVSALNVFRIPEILDRLVDIGAIRQEEENWCNFAFNMVEYSPRYHVSALSDDLRNTTIERIEQWIENFNNKNNTDCRSIFLHLLWHLKKPFNYENARDLKEVTETIDRLRNEKTVEIIPELIEVLS